MLPKKSLIKGNKKLDMSKKLKIIGTSVPKHDAKMRTTGEAIYGHDIALPNMLHASILRTEYPYAEFTIDVSQAKKWPGVVCVFMADEV